ncbi:hypothetical protein [Luteimonas fraxinea]|uniref:Uncharacterized protein n=1 Tax=Luteimonas fraxinea TaxID=2901869 RepID=A0ABS8UDL6_9GAMM|nr:hypothetical protein [Luteimonas fraxinea]MCD9097072.1 hypothetical protein [Luteimonas fraxinea]
MSALTDAIRAHFITCVDSGRFDGEGLDKLLAVVESVQYRAAFASRPAANEAPADDGLDVTDCSGILKGNADLEQPAHDAHVRVMEGREAARRG